MSATLVDALTDEPAETAIAGIALLSHHGAITAADVAEHLYDPAKARVIDIATRIGNHLDLEQRIDTIAEAAGVDPHRARAWVDRTPVMWDTSGAIRARVLEAAARRQHIAELYDQLTAATGLPVTFGAPH